MSFLKRTRRESDLQKLAAVMYVFAGENEAPERFLDTLSAVANGEPYSLDGLLPYSHKENGNMEPPHITLEWDADFNPICIPECAACAKHKGVTGGS